MVRPEIKNVSDAIAALKGLRNDYEKSLPRLGIYKAYEELLRHFDRPREFLAQEPNRDWETETELKAAYEAGIVLVTESFEMLIDCINKTINWKSNYRS